MASSKPKVIRYKHHSNTYVAVMKKNKGKHRQSCLCYSCRLFHPKGPKTNCGLAQLLFSICCIYDIVTPVWECPNFIADKNKCISD